MRRIVDLPRDGYKRGTTDLDATQATLSAYRAARKEFARARAIYLPLTRSVRVFRELPEPQVESCGPSSTGL